MYFPLEYFIVPNLLAVFSDFSIEDMGSQNYYKARGSRVLGFEVDFAYTEQDASVARGTAPFSCNTHI